MELNDMMYYLGLTSVVALLLYVAIRALTLQMNIVEGLASSRNTSTNDNIDKDKVADAIKSNTNTTEDNLLISKYRTNYERTIIELESNVGYAMLSTVLNNAESISANPTSPESQTTISSINNLKTFMETLNSAMKILDSK